MAKSCSIEGCDRSARSRGWCGRHYSRWLIHGDPLFVRATINQHPCSVAECEERARSKGMCPRHYQHWKKYGTPLKRPRIEVCTIEGCERKPRSATATMCEMHYYRIRRNGHLEVLSTRIETPGYRAAHWRVAKDCGKASEHACVDCREPGAHWSFAWKDVEPERWLWEYFNGTWLAYTGEPDDYEPRCHKCARRYDSAFAMQGWRAEQVAR